jgi:hypothetical protein
VACMVNEIMKMTSVYLCDPPRQEFGKARWKRRQMTNVKSRDANGLGISNGRAVSFSVNNLLMKNHSDRY